MNGEGSIPSGHLMVRLGAYVIPMFPAFNFICLMVYFFFICQDSRVWSKGVDLRSIADASWVQIPLLAYLL